MGGIKMLKKLFNKCSRCNSSINVITDFHSLFGRSIIECLECDHYMSRYHFKECEKISILILMSNWNNENTKKM